MSDRESLESLEKISRIRGFDVYGHAARAVVLRHLSTPDLMSLAARLMRTQANSGDGDLEFGDALAALDDMHDVAGELERRADYGG